MAKDKGLPAHPDQEVQPEDVGQPQLRPADLDNADRVLTIADAEERMSRYGGEEGKSAKRVVLQFAEVLGRQLWLGKRAKNALIAKYGTRLRGWVDQSVPLVCVHVSVGGKQSYVVQIAEDFDGALKAAKPRKGK
jgi:hypothetical protein